MFKSLEAIAIAATAFFPCEITWAVYLPSFQ
jgi:hypothetical protein